MKIERKCFFICENKEDVTFLQKVLFKDGVSWLYHGTKIDKFKNKYHVDYPVYMGASDDNTITWFKESEKSFNITYYFDWKMININKLKRKEKLKKLNTL